jgi:membrane protease YdiL (CAAX protease family)/predicted pyridoxine 5'-phosphate oxidase superfamily flavin-nucleotide-binding protein
MERGTTDTITRAAPAIRPALTVLPGSALPGAVQPGSEGEHRLQETYGTQDRARRFYRDQVLEHLNERMCEFVARQEMMFVATADASGECDCTFRAGPPGFVQVLDNRRVAWPEYRGNGVMASLGNISENGHVGLLFVDFFRDVIGLHVNGHATIVADAPMRQAHPDLPTDPVPGRRPERWVTVHVEEAYIHCAKHIPRLAKLPRDRSWGTDDVKRKGGDFFGVKEAAATAVPDAVPAAVSEPGYGGRVTIAPPARRALGTETLLVLGVSVGASAVYSMLTLVDRLTAAKPLAQQTAALNVSRTPDRPWLDLTYQLVGVLLGVVPALLAVHLVNRDPGDARGLFGLDRRRPAFDLALGVGLAAIIGVPGLGLYAAARALGLSAQVVPAALGTAWWVIPVLILSAVQNAVLEEIVVVGYLVTRLRNGLGWPIVWTVAASAVLRGSYHLYQGWGAFAGNAIMGVVFALVFLQTRRVLPLIVAHSILDVVAFVGYALLHNRLAGF